MWLFWDDDWEFRGWYVNLEDPHERIDHAVVTQDHILDVVVRPDRTTQRKDEDELDSAVASGRHDSAAAERFRGNAAAAEDVVRRWGSPFCDRWEDWRPDPGWPTPQLPAGLIAAATSADSGRVGRNFRGQPPRPRLVALNRGQLAAVRGK